MQRCTHVTATLANIHAQQHSSCGCCSIHPWRSSARPKCKSHNGLLGAQHGRPLLSIHPSHTRMLFCQPQNGATATPPCIYRALFVVWLFNSAGPSPPQLAHHRLARGASPSRGSWIGCQTPAAVAVTGAAQRGQHVLRHCGYHRVGLHRELRGGALQQRPVAAGVDGWAEGY